jgi:S1-C subfamily serine protease
MLRHEVVAYITGLILVVSANVLLGLRVITFENSLVLITIALGVMGFSTFASRNTQTQLNRILYSFRNLQPMVYFRDNKIVVSVVEGSEPAKLVKELVKLFGLPVEVEEHGKMVLLGDVEVSAGDGIRPVGKNWEGSLGYYYKGYYYTNAHVLPEVGMQVQHVKTGTVIGVSDWVSNIKTISWYHLLLSYFGYKLPANTVDAARIKPTAEFTYRPLHNQRDQIDDPIGPDDTLVAAGRTSGVREGPVISSGVTIIVQWPHNGKYAIFTDVIKAEFPARPGDSGGPVVCNFDSNIVGLVFAGPQDGSFALVIKASNIEKAVVG